jgi:hypothetical protein
MEQMTGQMFRNGEMVQTDGMAFVDCTFESAQLVYRGGEHPSFDRCRFGSDVSWHFQGAALKTIQLLQRIGNDEGGERFIADVFQKGKFFADEDAAVS